MCGSAADGQQGFDTLTESGTKDGVAEVSPSRGNVTDDLLYIIRVDTSISKK